MKHISFEWAGSGALASELEKPLVRASISLYAGHPNILTLWREDGTWLRAYSKMHDIEDRLEVGVLTFELANEEPTDSIRVEIPMQKTSKLEVYKLSNIDADVSFDSGVVLECPGGSFLSFVAGAFPYTLAIKGLFSLPHSDEPEYDWTSYTRSRLGA